MTGRTGKAAGNEGDMMDSENKVGKKERNYEAHLQWNRRDEEVG